MTLEPECVEAVPRSGMRGPAVLPAFISRPYPPPDCHSPMAHRQSSVHRSQSVRSPDSAGDSGRRFRSRIGSAPGSRQRDGRSDSADSESHRHRLRNFALTSKGLINRGDSFRSKSDGTDSGPDSPRAQAAPSVQFPATPVERFRVAVLGAAQVGKSSVTRQFATSEYISAYDSAQEDENEKSVTVVLNGRESEMTFLEIPDDQEALPSLLVSGTVDAYLVVYSVTCRSSFVRAQKLLEQWQRWDGGPPLILVGNKADLARCRVVGTENGRSLATRVGCKFIETSAGINHQLDELLVGILSQIRLKSHRARGRHVRGHTTDLSGQRKARGLIGRILKKACLRSKSCDNLHVW